MVREADTTPAPQGPLAGEETHTPAKGKVFLRLFLQNERRLYAYVLALLPNRADADDVLQEASLVMWDKFDAERPPSPRSGRASPGRSGPGCAGASCRSRAP